MTRNDDKGSSPNTAANEQEAATLARRTFLAETMAISAAVTALLSESSALAQNKEEAKDSLLDRIRSQFSEEAQVAAKYAAFAAQAKGDNRPQVARLFQALVTAEMFHAEWLLRLMNGVTATADNLKVGADYEAFLVEKILPADAAQAKQEKNVKAQLLFEKLMAACTLHEKVLRQARERIVAGQDLEVQPVRICPNCGNVIVGAAPDKCPVCATPGTKFIDVA